MKHNAQKNEAFFDRFKHFLRRLGEEEDGGMLPMMAVMLLSIIALTGLAIDGARAYYVKDVLQRSVDAAGLAAGHALDPEDSVKDAQEFFDANFAAAEGVALQGVMIPTVDPENNEIIDITGSATLNATFMNIFGFETLSVDASAEITRETRGMELSLVIDNTGSMDFTISSNDPRRRIDVLLPAARNLIDIVYGDNDENPNLWVSVVPFVANVNVGGVHTNFLSQDGQDFIDDGEYYSAGWKGCVFARNAGLDQTDQPPSPSIGGIEPFYWPDTFAQVSPYGRNATINLNFQVNRNDWLTNSGTDIINEVNNTSFQYINSNIGTIRPIARGPNRGCASAITPLVASKQTVLSAINEMEPWGFGGTTTNFGLVWGWRTLSPRWRNLWKGGDEPDRLPLDYTEPFMDKVIVLLTDGENSIGNRDLTSFMYEDDLEDAPDTIEAVAERELDRRLTNTCNNAKDEGIIIYTIAFSSGVQQNIRDLLAACASNPNFYFDASDGDALEEAFETIGRQLSNLRLSK